MPDDVFYDNKKVKICIWVKLRKGEQNEISIPSGGEECWEQKDHA